MRNYIPFGWFFLLVLFSSSAFAVTQKALVYKGPGACDDGCYQAAFMMALKAGYDPVFVGPTELNSASNDADKQKLFKDVALWVQPGGHSKQVLQAMTVQMVDSLRAFVKQGGGYVGFCAGAFASTEYVGTTGYLGYDLLPGSTKVYKSKRVADIIPIKWNGKIRQMYWEGGPYLYALPRLGTDASNAEPIAYYPNGQIAAARALYGKGKVFVTGMHPEAPQDWRDYYHLIDSDGSDEELALEMIQWATH